MRAGYVEFRSTSGRSAVDRTDAVAPVRGERTRVSRGPPAHGLYGADRHLLRVDDLPAVDCGVPRRVLLGGSPGGGDRGPPIDLGDGPRRGSGDMALHHTHPGGHAPPFRQI